MEAAISSSVVKEDCSDIAHKLQTDVGTAERLLTKLALRRVPLSDSEALRLLLSLLPECEVVTQGKHLSIPLNQPALKIWLDRQLSAGRRHPGEFVRFGIVKVTPKTLLGLLDDMEVVPSPRKALERIETRLGGPDWVREAKREWRNETTWRATIDTFGSLTNLLGFLPKLAGLMG